VTQELSEGTVTILFTDVEGSTDLTTHRGDEAAQEIPRAQQQLVRSIGDGFMVAFASARRAVARAVGVQRALEEYNRSQPLEEQVRVIVLTGAGRGFCAGLDKKDMVAGKVHCQVVIAPWLPS
jgi:class 3 adenylate cyclase